MYEDITRRLVEVCQGVDPLLTVLDYEPAAVHSSPTLYWILAGFNRNQTGQVTAMRYNITGRLLVRWTENETAEQTLAKMVNAIPYALEVDMTLGLPNTVVAIDMGVAEYRNVAGTVYRSLDFTANALEKGLEGI